MSDNYSMCISVDGTLIKIPSGYRNNNETDGWGQFFGTLYT